MGLFGGGNSSSTNQTLNETTNYATSIDKRNVVSDQAVALSGDYSTLNKVENTSTWMQDNTNNSTWLQDNTNNSTFFQDNSDRSTNTSTSNSNNTSMVDSRSTTSITQMFDKSSRDNSTHFTDSSTKDNSTYFSDSSVRDSSTHFADSSVKTSLDSHNTSMVDNSNRSVTYSSTDYGSVGKALDSLGMMSSKSLDVAAGGVNGSIDALKYLADKNQQSVAMAFDFTKSASANSVSNSAAVLGFANSAIAKTAEAFAEAKDGGESKNIMYALMAIAVVGVAFALRK